MSKTFPAFLLLFLCLSTFGQAGKKTVSFTTQCKSGEAICHTQEIVRHDLIDGKEVSSEIIFTSKTLDIRFDLGDNHIIEDHWLVNNWGDVIDLKERKAVFEGNGGDLIAIINKKVLIDRDRRDDEDLYSYDLVTGAIRTIPSREDIEQLDEAHFSPDNKLLVQWTAKTGHAFFSIDENLNLELIKYMPGTYTAYCSFRCSDLRRKPPVIWIDNSTILTQRDNGILVTVNTSGKVRKIVTIDIKEAPDGLPYLERDSEGKIVYDCDQKYVIDVARKKYSVIAH